MPRKVLVADDDQLLVALLQEALEKREYHVLPAFDGMEVLDQLGRRVPDYIVLDLDMPKMDGVQVYRHLKEDPRLRSIPLIVLTGRTPEAARWLRDISADAYIPKRGAEAILRDLCLILQAFEEETPPPAWTQELQGLEQIRPRRLVTEPFTHTAPLNALLQNLGEGVVFLDPSHRIIYVNPAGAALLGRHERELAGAPLSAILGGGHEDSLLQALRALASREGLATERFAYAYRQHTFHITITNLLGEGRAAGQLLLIRDVSPLVRRIQELAALNELATLLTSTLDLDELFRLIMERIQDLMGVEASSLLLKEDKGDELVFRIGLGEHGEAVQGRRLKVGEGIAGWVFQQGSALIVPDVRQDHRFYQGVDYDTGFTTKSMLCVPLKTRDKVIGVIQVLNGLTKPAFDEDDLNLLSAIAAHAATAIENARLYAEVKFHAEELERKVEERTREVEAANVQLEEALHRVEEASHHKSVFLATVSHELQTPLNTIIGFSDTLENQHFGPLTQDQARHVCHIRKAGQHLLQLISDLLDLSKVEAGRVELYPERLEVGEIITDMVTMIRAQADKKGPSVEFFPEKALPPVYADPHRFRQILYNLLSNAVKFTPSGGRVTISARVQRPTSEVQSPRGPDVGPWTLDAKTFVEIAVADTGIGIKSEDQDKLFQPFMQLETPPTRRHEGTGLGLAIAKHLVEMQGGRIWVESAGEGKGSTFTFTLPLAHGRATRRRRKSEG
ncbi:MAG: ATP-binding protein [Candidatus Methylomirabilales bacterium]